VCASYRAIGFVRLFLVETLADAWGSHPVTPLLHPEAGKVVWFRLKREMGTGQAGTQAADAAAAGW